MIKLTCKKDFADFKVGEVFEFKEPCYIVGSNGSGKTTLLGAIRAFLTTDTTGGTWDQNFSRYEKALKHFDVETSFTEGRFCFSREDSAESQTYDAVSMIKSGGMTAQRLSRGEASMMTFAGRLGTKTDPPSGLVVLDEADTGFDIPNQLLFSKKIIPNIIRMFGCFPLVTTHNYLVLLNSTLPIYLLDKREFVDVETVKQFFEEEPP